MRSSGRFLEKVPDMAIASLSDLPLTLLCQKICKWCWNAPAERKSQFCGPMCEKKRKKPELDSVARAIAWDRDRGKCCMCGLDTIRLAEDARIEYMKGGANAKSVYAALWYGKGYKKEDFKGIAWRLLEGKTVCVPCYRFVLENNKQRPSKDKFKQQDLFGSGGES